MGGITGIIQDGKNCTGSLVAPTLVLTAAHCVISLRPSDWEIIFGYGTSAAESVDVAHVYKFQDSSGASQDVSRDDLAVLELKVPVIDRQPVALDTDTGTVERATQEHPWMIELGYGEFKPGRAVYTIKRAGQYFDGARPDFAEKYQQSTQPAGSIGNR